MTTKTKVIIILSTIGILALASLVGWQAYKMGKNKGLEEASHNPPQPTQEGWTKASKATQDQIEALARTNTENYSRLTKAIEAMGLTLSTVAVSQGRTQVVIVRDSRSDSSTPNPQGPEVPTTPEGVPLDIHRYTQNIQHRRLLSKQGVLLADVDFNAASERPWSTKLHPLRYRVTTLVAEGDDEGEISLHHELRMDNPDQPGPVEQIELTEHTVRTTTANPSFELWDPALMLSLGVDLRSWGPSLVFSLSSYGTRREERYRFINVGAGVTIEGQDLFLNLIPAMINTGRFLPLIDNLWVGPQGTFIPRDQSFSLGVVVGVTL